jgi:hypothetical protein
MSEVSTPFGRGPHLKREMWGTRHPAHLEFRAEAFNTFNHTNPGNPNTTLSNANYGKITSAVDPRILEFAARLKF